MINNGGYEVIIIGGSYAGLSAAMALGRAVRKVLIIDSGKPCNIPTPHSHNFITNDGKTPAQISASAREQVLKYNTITLHQGLAIRGAKTEKGFEVETQTGDIFGAKKLIFATGLIDVMQEIKGFAECWGISILHCPYCHGYEVRNQKTGLISNGDIGFDFTKVVSQWTKDLTLFTNGKSTLSREQTDQLKKHNINIIENEIESVEHNNGMIKNILLNDKSKVDVSAVYARPNLIQHCNIPKELGCELTEPGLVKVDMLQKTTVPGVYAIGDNSSFARSVSVSVASGTMAGASLNKEIIEEEF